jgi:hypothetical protein
VHQEAFVTVHRSLDEVESFRVGTHGRTPEGR